MAKRAADIAGLLKFIKYSQNSKGFDGVLEKVKILSVGEGKCFAELKVDSEHVNVLGGLHGGLSATIVDLVPAWALMSKIGNEIPHVSVGMNLSYLKGAKLDDTIIIDANVVRVGKTLAFLETEIKNKDTGDLLVKGSHTKFLLN